LAFSAKARVEKPESFLRLFHSYKLEQQKENALNRSYVALAILICLAGCKSEPNPSIVQQRTIVQQVEDAGAGDLSRADVAGLQIWLTKHSDVARNIASQCKEAMKTDAAWQNSAEGRICIAEKDAGFSN
jgi:hypothetical protein